MTQQLEATPVHDAPPVARPNIGDYWRLTKPTIVVLLLITTIGAMFIAAEGAPPLDLLFWVFIGGSLAAGGANAINSFVDRDIDPLMSRTSQRPLPRNRVPPLHALLFGVGAVLLSVLVYGLFVNWLSAGLALLGAIYYAGIYTGYLKRSTPHNIVIGGGAGAIPPLVGWAAVHGSLDFLAFVLFAIIFFWTPPHTWALTLLVQKDYERVGVPMFPVVFGEDETRRQMVLYTIVLVGITLLPVATGDLSLFYGAAALLLGNEFLRQALILWRRPSKSRSNRLYRFSNNYLALLFLAMVLDRIFATGGFLP